MFPNELIRMSAGHNIQVWLKSGSRVEGLLYVLDSYMNLRMKKVTLTTKGGAIQKMDELFIKGIEITSIQIPDEAMDQALRVEKQRLSIAKSRGPRQFAPGRNTRPFHRNFRDNGQREGNFGNNNRGKDYSQEERKQEVPEIEDEGW